MSAALDISALRATIQDEMDRQGFSRRRLSREAGIGETAVRDLLERTANPGIATLHKVADALKVPLTKLTGMDSVPLVGKIGAGGLVAYQSDDDDHEFVPRPPSGAGDIIALEVLGDSMLPKYEAGDVIYIENEDSPIDRQVGEYCAIRLADGGTYLKQLATGGTRDRYVLRSLNAADIENVEIVWARPVLFIMPRKARGFF